MTTPTGILVPAPIRPEDSADVYPTSYANEALGGHYQVLTTTDRNSIPAARRALGMLCTVTTGPYGPIATYQLQTGLTNADWVMVFSAGALPVVAYRNRLLNGAVLVANNAVYPVTLTSTLQAVADRWLASANAGSPSLNLSNIVTAGLQQSFQFTGATSTTTVHLTQRIAVGMTPSANSAFFSCYLYNNTGGAFSPVLSLRTPTVDNNFAALNADNTFTLPACLDSSWTNIVYQVDLSALVGVSDLSKGLQVDLRIPSGSLNSGAKLVYLTGLQLANGAYPTEFEFRPRPVEVSLTNEYWDAPTYLTYAETVFAQTQSSVAQTVNGATQLNYQLTSEDNISGMTTGPGSFYTGKRSGIYQVTISWKAAATAPATTININGSDVVTAQGYTISSTVRLNAGDILKAYAYSSASVSTSGVPAENTLSVVWLGEG